MTMRPRRALYVLIAVSSTLTLCHGDKSSRSSAGSRGIDPTSMQRRERKSSPPVSSFDAREPARERADSNLESVLDANYFDSPGSSPYGDIVGSFEQSLLDDAFEPDEDSGTMTDSERMDDDHDDEFGDASPMFSGKKGPLYDAYNQLHTLAQDFKKPFDAPAVVVVGHQSSGKSALIEAIMGFQFNQVGGGTKTRRPVALRMQYNPRCARPRCFLVGEDGVERPMTLSAIQEYIEKENMRLERDPRRSFESREINVRMEYKYCPNMILIDTPGLIAAPRVPRGRGETSSAFQQQRALLASAREAERLVIDKMSCPDYLILCVEDTSDWKHGATREVVQKADPDLSRTVVVNTKFDTKLPQFGSPADVQDFLRARIIDRISPHKLGGPFFTSVPSGRVGRHSENFDPESAGEFLYENDDEFVAACGETESTDKAMAMQRLKRLGKEGERTAGPLVKRIGLGGLKSFLEDRVDESYRRNVAKIIPMLQAEYSAAERRLKACEAELESISVDRLKAGADAFCDQFCVCLRKALQGSITAPASLFGETLNQETTSAGSFNAVQGAPIAVSDRTWDRLIETEVGGKDHRLYGGSQYHRTLREFNLATKCLRLPSITEDEIANAAGIGETHDGVNFLHAACVISIEKARLSFEPLLEALRIRITHVMEKLCPVTEYMLRETQERGARVSTFKYMEEDSPGYNSKASQAKVAADISQNPQFRQLIRNIFDKFVQKCSDSTLSRCHDDLSSITKYVTWNLDDRSGGALQRALPDQTDIVQVYQVAVKAAKKSPAGAKADKGDKGEKGEPTPATDDSAEGGILTKTQPTPLIRDQTQNERDYMNLLQLIEEAACSREADRTNMVVGGLVHFIVTQWRETFCRNVVTKVNCYFMLPFVDEFHRFLRKELQRMYDGDHLSDVFDLSAARRSLQQQKQELLNECSANKRLQEKFEYCARMMRQQQVPPAVSSASLIDDFGIATRPSAGDRRRR